MFKLDDNLLIELGLGSLPPADKNQMLKHIYETLEMRVGMTLAQQMSDQQLNEFEAFIDSNDEKGALSWLESNFPDYKNVVAGELEKLKAEVKTAAPQIVAAAAAQAAGQVDPAAQAQVNPAVQPAAVPPTQPMTPNQVPPTQAPVAPYDPTQPSY